MQLSWTEEDDDQIKDILEVTPRMRVLPLIPSQMGATMNVCKMQYSYSALHSHKNMKLTITFASLMYVYLYKVHVMFTYILMGCRHNSGKQDQAYLGNRFDN